MPAAFSALPEDRQPKGVVLVTGATGFVARSVLSALSAAGWAVRGTARPGAALPQGVESAPIGGIGPATDWSAALQGVDCVVHLAARVHVMRDEAADPLAAFRIVNAQGSEALARQAAAAGVRRLVFISSIKVNGEVSPGRPFTERDSPAPADPYALSKWEAEQQLTEIARETGLEVVIVRPPMVYGPGVRANFLRLLQAVERGLPLPLARVGNRRSLIYSRNLADFVVRCVDDPRAAGELFLVSDGEDLSAPDLVRLMARGLGRRARLVPVPPALLSLTARALGRREEAQRLIGSLQLDISHARNRLGWRPPCSVEEGMAETVAWYVRRHLQPASG